MPNNSPITDRTAVQDDEQPTTRRIHRLSLHLNPTQSPTDDAHLQIHACSARGKIELNMAELTKFMRGKNRDIQDRIYEYFNARPDLQTPIEISKDEHRELCMRQLAGIVREAGIRPFVYVVDDPAKYFAITEAVGSIDMSLGIKMGVQYRGSMIEVLIISSLCVFLLDCHTQTAFF